MVRIVTDVDQRLIDRLVKLEVEAFGNGGLNEWHLVPIIRHGRLFIIEHSGEVVGSVQYMRDWNNSQRAYMIGVTVAKEVRGQGVGTELLAKSIEALLDDKITEVELTVDANNAAAIKVYQEKLGFNITEARRNEYGPGQDRLVMLLLVTDFRKVYK